MGFSSQGHTSREAKELAVSAEERRKIRQERVDNFVALEKIVKNRLAAGDGTIDEALSATATRIQAEIDLLRAEDR